MEFRKEHFFFEKVIFSSGLNADFMEKACFTVRLDLLFLAWRAVSRFTVRPGLPSLAGGSGPQAGLAVRLIWSPSASGGDQINLNGDKNDPFPL